MIETLARRLPWRLLGWGAVATALLLPKLIGAPWTLSDYIIAGVVLGTAGLTLELVAWRAGDLAYRLGALVAVGTAVLLIWINGAVGVIGGEQEPANALLLAVIAVGLLGALLARFRAGGLSFAMAATALAQLLVPPAAASFTPLAFEPRVLGLTVIFSGGWLLAAWFFRQAARRS